MGKIFFSILMGKIMEKTVRTGNFLHYWNGEKEWGKIMANGEKLLMKMGEILVWILIVVAVIFIADIVVPL